MIRTVLAATAAFVAMAAMGLAVAQDNASTTPAAPAPPASRCPVAVPAPTLPDAITTEKQFNDSTATFNAWVDQMEPINQCRQAEIRELQAKSRAIQAEFNARIAEFRAADDANKAVAEKFSAARTAFVDQQSRGRPKR